MGLRSAAHSFLPNTKEVDIYLTSTLISNTELCSITCKYHDHKKIFSFTLFGTLENDLCGFFYLFDFQKVLTHSALILHF